MAMDIKEVERLIKEALPDATSRNTRSCRRW